MSFFAAALLTPALAHLPPPTELTLEEKAEILDAYYSFGERHHSWTRFTMGQIKPEAQQERLRRLVIDSRSRDGKELSMEFIAGPEDRPASAKLQKVAGVWKVREFRGINSPTNNRLPLEHWLNHRLFFGSNSDVVKMAEQHFGQVIKSLNLRLDQVYARPGPDRTGWKDSVGVKYSGRIQEGAKTIPSSMEAEWNLYSGLLITFKSDPYVDL